MIANRMAKWRARRFGIYYASGKHGDGERQMRREKERHLRGTADSLSANGSLLATKAHEIRDRLASMGKLNEASKLAPADHVHAARALL